MCVLVWMWIHLWAPWCTCGRRSLCVWREREREREREWEREKRERERDQTVHVCGQPRTVCSVTAIIGVALQLFDGHISKHEYRVGERLRIMTVISSKFQQRKHPAKSLFDPTYFMSAGTARQEIEGSLRQEEKLIVIVIFPDVVTVDLGNVQLWHFVRRVRTRRAPRTIIIIRLWTRLQLTSWGSDRYIRMWEEGNRWITNDFDQRRQAHRRTDHGRERRGDRTGASASQRSWGDLRINRSN